MIENEDLSSSSTAGGWTYDVNTKSLSWSTVSKEIHGLDANAQPDFNKIDQFYAPVEGFPTFTELINRCLSGEEFFREELHIIQPHGGVKKVVCSGLLDKSDANKLVILGSFSTKNQSISGSNNTKNQLIGTWSWDMKTNEVTWSKELCEIFEVDIVKNTSSTHTVEEYMQFVHPDDIEWQTRVTGLAFAEKRPVETHISIITKNGKVKPVYGTAEQVFDAEGNVTMLIGSLQDVSMGAKVKAKVSDFFHLGTELMAILNLKGEFENVNPRWQYVLGYNVAELVSKNFLDIVHPDDLERAKNALKILIEGRVLRQFVFRVRSAENKYKWIEFSCVPDMREGLIVTNARDISEQISTNETLLSFNRELQEKNKELEQFAFITSHDLQEPMNTIQSMVHMLKEDASSKLSPEELQLMGYIEEASERMSQQIKGILDYSRIGRSPLKESIDLNAKVEDILSDLDTLIQRNGTKINISKLPVIQGARTDIRMLFQNLISNAVKFSSTSKSPSVDILSEELDKHFQFTISDNGIGIDPTYHDKIFQIFKRLNSREEFDGTGIGLAYCKKIVSLHGGKIRVDSNLHEGAKFIFTIAKQD